LAANGRHRRSTGVSISYYFVYTAAGAERAGYTSDDVARDVAAFGASTTMLIAAPVAVVEEDGLPDCSGKISEASASDMGDGAVDDQAGESDHDHGEQSAQGHNDNTIDSANDEQAEHDYDRDHDEGSNQVEEITHDTQIKSGTKLGTDHTSRVGASHDHGSKPAKARTSNKRSKASVGQKPSKRMRRAGECVASSLKSANLFERSNNASISGVLAGAIVAVLVVGALISKKVKKIPFKATSGKYGAISQHMPNDLDLAEPVANIA
jgi:cobalamin biosynthesis Mg chelatase CobN